MSKPIEPGCRALVVKTTYPENLGAIVRVLGLYRSGDKGPDGRKFFHPDPSLAAWGAETLGRLLAVPVVPLNGGRQWGSSVKVFDRMAYFRLDGLIRLDDDIDEDAVDETIQVAGYPPSRELDLIEIQMRPGAQEF